MNTLDDLRTTLSAHVPATDVGIHDRAASVRSRVQVVRRRRRVSAVVGAVAAVAAVVAGIALPRTGTDKAESGLAAAASMQVGGFDYDLVRVVSGRPGQETVRTTLPTSSRRTVVVLLAQDLHGGSATLQTPVELGSTDRFADRLVADGAGVPRPIWWSSAGASDAGDAEAKASGAGPRARVGIAVYRRTSTMPDGVVDATGSAVFRRHVADRELAQAAFLNGRPEGSLTFTGPLSEVRIAASCGVPEGGSERRGPYLLYSVDGDGVNGGACEAPSEDAASNGGASFADDGATATHTIRFWTATRWDRHSSTAPAPVAVPGAVAGMALYVGGETVDVHGNTVDKLVEFDGQTWKLDDAIESRPGDHRIEATWDDATEHLLVGYAVERTREVVVSGNSVGGDSFSDRTDDDVRDARFSSVSGVVLPASEETTYTVSWPAKYADASGAVLVYRPLG